MEDEDIWVMYNNVLTTNQNVRKMNEGIFSSENAINHNIRKQHQKIFEELAKQHNGVGEFLENIGNALQDQHETILSLFGAIVEPRVDPTSSAGRRLQQVTNETFDLDNQTFVPRLQPTNYTFPSNLLGDDGSPISILASQQELAKALNESTATLQQVVDNSTASIQQVVTTVENSIKTNVNESAVSIQEVVSLVEGSLKVSNSSLSVGENIGQVRGEMSGVYALRLDIECLSQSNVKHPKSSPLPAAMQAAFLVRSSCFGSDCSACIKNVRAVYSVTDYDGVNTFDTQNHTAEDLGIKELGEGLQHVTVKFHALGTFKAEDIIMYYITAERCDGEGKATESAYPYRRATSR